MANTFAPFGFRYLGLKDGTPPNFGLARGYMVYSGSAYCGDPLKISSGLVTPATVTGNTGAAICGVAVGFKWNSTALGRPTWGYYYPGNDSVSNANVEVLFANNPNAIFECQVGTEQGTGTAGGPAVQADVGSGFNFMTGTGNAQNGQSGFALDYSTKNATLGSLPFVLYYLDQSPKTDPASAGNIVRVALNLPTTIG